MRRFKQNLLAIIHMPTISTGPCRPSCRSISSRIDPFDRLIIAQAYLEGTVLGTQDWRIS